MEKYLIAAAVLFVIYLAYQQHANPRPIMSSRFSAKKKKKVQKCPKCPVLGTTKCPDCPQCEICEDCAPQPEIVGLWSDVDKNNGMKSVWINYDSNLNVVVNNVRSGEISETEGKLITRPMESRVEGVLSDNGDGTFSDTRMTGMKVKFTVSGDTMTVNIGLPEGSRNMVWKRLGNSSN
jgi:hypothetical protein